MLKMSVTVRGMALEKIVRDLVICSMLRLLLLVTHHSSHQGCEMPKSRTPAGSPVLKAGPRRAPPADCNAAIITSTPLTRVIAVSLEGSEPVVLDTAITSPGFRSLSVSGG